MITPIPYGRHHITEDDIQAVVEVLKSDWLTQGPKIAEFESAFSEYIGVKYSIAVSNGTAALHLCALAMNIKKGDKVITTPITFAASANCVKYAGGDVVFADIDPETYLLDINEVEKLLNSSPKGTYKGIIPVDFAGRAIDLEAFRKLADEYNCWIIEDACHAPGGYFTDRDEEIQKCGNGKYAELAIFSFHPVKHIATGEGGMITTNNEDFYNRLLNLRTHGITKDRSKFINSIDTAIGVKSDNAGTYPNWYYELQELGFNYRLSDIHAALGLSQLKRAEKNLQRRREIAANYQKAFSGRQFIKVQTGPEKGHGYHLYIIEADDRKGLYDHLLKHSIFAQVHYIPNHLQPYYQKQGWGKGDLPVAEKYYEKCLSIPMYHSLTEPEQETVIQIINNYYK